MSGGRGEQLRARFLFLALGCVPVFLCGWFGFLQVFEAGELSRGRDRAPLSLSAGSADRQRDRHEQLPGPRGTITDRHGAVLADGRPLTVELYQALRDDEIAKLRRLYGEDRWAAGKFALAIDIFDELSTADELADFLTLPAYEHLLDIKE